MLFIYSWFKLLISRFKFIHYFLCSISSSDILKESLVITMPWCLTEESDQNTLHFPRKHKVQTKSCYPHYQTLHKEMWNEQIKNWLWIISITAFITFAIMIEKWLQYPLPLIEATYFKSFLLYQSCKNLERR